MSPLNQPPGSAGGIVEFNIKSGRIVGYISVKETPALHSLEVNSDGEPMTGVGNRMIRFKRQEQGSVDAV